jgi:tryptophan synthase beta chain
MEDVIINLPQRDIPHAWYNVAADLPGPLPPPLNPGTGGPIDPSALSRIFPPKLIEQEVSAERWIDVPSEVLEVYALWRPSPLVRARALEKHLGTPARIYYKNEAVSPPGSHKPNTACAQAYFNKIAGVGRLATETGAGQWGSALAFACCKFGLKCKVYMVRCSYEQKPYRKVLMRTWGADIVASPSADTNSGRAVREKDPDCSGSLGIAISEAVEDAASRDDTNYSLGSVLNHVLLHQTLIGLEAKKQLAAAGEKSPPNVVIGCAGGGSNMAGLVFPFVPDKIKDNKIRLMAVEPTACPSLTRGPYRYDFGDTACTTPLLAMYTLGHNFIPSPIHAGGLRYHGMAPLVSYMCHTGMLEARAFHQKEVFDAAIAFARTQGTIPAPETAHAIKAVVDEAMRCKAAKKEEVILFNFSGHGHFDMGAYEKYFDGTLTDYDLPQEVLERALAELPNVPAPAT